jgi:putative CocE/NonD family hydrolase
MLKLNSKYYTLCKLFFSCFLVFQLIINAQYVTEYKGQYFKKEYQISMRDSIKLHTVIYSPADTSEDYPILLWRTPYGSNPYGPEKFRKLPSHLYREKFIFVFQDVRGKFLSEGTYENIRPISNDGTDESTDTYDTIEWLLNNIPDNNGNVGIYGISYPGFYASQSLVNSHPALKAVSPQAPIADWFIGDDFHHHGAFTLALAFNFFSRFEQPNENKLRNGYKEYFNKNSDSYNFFKDLGPLGNANNEYFMNEIPFWNDLMKHGNYDDFWQSRNMLQHFENIKPAVMTVGGWFDAEDLYGSLNTYKAIERKNENIFNILVMGPWFHGAWSRSNAEEFVDLKFDSNTSDFYRDHVELPFFNYFLKNKGNLNLPEALVFETGNNVWHYLDKYPPDNIEEREFFLTDLNKLSFDMPDYVEGIQYDEFISDPSKPVPYTAKVEHAGTFYNKKYVLEDQRFASSRTDVLVYESPVLTADFTIAGQISAELSVSTSGTDADWVVKIIDVYPDTSKIDSSKNPPVIMGGYQMLIRGEIFRGKYRNSYKTPEPFIPNEPTGILIPMQDVFHTFKKGHKLMVQIQSSWFPLFDMNPQTFTDIYSANENDFKPAIHKVYHSREFPSKIIVGELKKQK